MLCCLPSTKLLLELWHDKKNCLKWDFFIYNWIAFYDAGKRAVPTAPAGSTAESAGGPAGGVEVTLDPSELELEPEAVAARYERHMRETRPKAHEDLSDMLADHVARQKVFKNKLKKLITNTDSDFLEALLILFFFLQNKRKRQQNTDSKQSKKYKEFKF